MKCKKRPCFICFLSVAIARSVGEALIYGILKYFNFLFFFFYIEFISLILLLTTHHMYVKQNRRLYISGINVALLFAILLYFTNNNYNIWYNMAM